MSFADRFDVGALRLTSCDLQLQWPPFGASSVYIRPCRAQPASKPLRKPGSAKPLQMVRELRFEARLCLAICRAVAALPHRAGLWSDHSP